MKYKYNRQLHDLPYFLNINNLLINKIIKYTKVTD